VGIWSRFDVLPVAMVLNWLAFLGMGNKKKKCRNCGRLFDPKGEGDIYCSALCRTTALFVGGGGDQRKPLAEGTPKKVVEAARAEAKKPQPKPSRRGSDVKFPRVKELFNIPIDKRWKLAQTFSPDEMAYARRLASRMLNEDRMIDELSSWNAQGESEAAADEGTVGESDDGSV